MMLLLLFGAVLAAFWWVSSAGQIGAWPLLIFAPLLIAAILQRTMPRRTPLDLPVLLLLLTALIGVWTAYDRDAAQHKLWLLVAAILLFYAIAWQPPTHLLAVAVFLALLGIGVAFFFLFTHDWHAFPPKFAALRPVVNSWMAMRPHAAPAPLHPNIAGSLIALGLPFQLLLLWHGYRRRNVALVIPAAILLPLTAFALLLTSSRGAMLALLIGLMSWATWRLAQQHRPRLQANKQLITALAAIALLATGLLVTSDWGWRIAAALDTLPGPASAMGRAQLASHTLDLIADFGLTGAGLGAFPGLYAHYMLGIPFYFLPNAHNILLDITLEQGILGLLAFILIVITSFVLLITFNPATRRLHASGGQAPTDLIAGATLAALIALLLHGMVEDTIYGSSALPLLLVMPAIVVALNRNTQRQSVEHVHTWTLRHTTLFGLAALALVTSLLLPHGRARWASNLGALIMARADLAHFPAEEWTLTQETPEIQEARNQFQQALHLNPAQRTALHRLGLLAFQQNDFDRAIIYLQNAHNLDPHHIGIRKALGYSYAWAGNPQQAHTHLQAAPFVAQELEAYVHWWQQQGHPERARIATRIRQSIQQTETIQ